MTTGVDIVGALLRAHAGLLAVVPIERIKAGALPDGVELTALLIRCASSVERQVLKRGATTRTTDRIAVTVRAASYREQRAAIALVKACCAGLTGDVGGGRSVSILTAGTGPDMRGPGDSFEQTQDFRVSYDA
ncbi:MAG TPA: hypothetical protein VF680_11680 [Allosphingosinicella sp.]|jgi:hypothetical protein